MRKLLLTLKILGAIVALLIVLLVGATFLLNSSSFQNKVMKRAAEMLSERLGTRVTVDSVHVSLMNQVVELYGVDVEDQQQRKMLQVEQLAAGIRLMALRHDEVDITKLASISGLQRNTVIEYDARIVVEDSISELWNRLSDLNCFWMASDTHRESQSPLEGINDRQGIFVRQYALSLYYMGFGGNHNKTTRFRRYTGDERGVTDADYRPKILFEYTDSAHLLKKNHWYHIRLEQIDGCVRYTIDGDTLVEYQDPTPLTQGYFGFRTTLSHAQIRSFSYTCK